MKRLITIGWWLGSLVLFWLACAVQQTWFRAETPVRNAFYTVEFLTCGAFLIAGAGLLWGKTNRINAVLFGGGGSVVVAGFIISLFLRDHCPDHGELSLFNFAIPFAVLIVVLAVFALARLAVALTREKRKTANNGADPIR